MTCYQTIISKLWNPGRHKVFTLLELDMSGSNIWARAADPNGIVGMI